MGTDYASDPFENAYYVTPFNLSRAANANSPYQIIDSGLPAPPAAISYRVVTAAAVAIPSFDGLNVLEANCLAANRTVTLNYQIEEPVGNPGKGIRKWDIVMWHYYDIAAVTRTIELRTFTFKGIQIDTASLFWRYNTGGGALAWVDSTEALPLVTTWVGLRIVQEEDVIRLYKWDLVNDSNWVNFVNVPISNPQIQIITLEVAEGGTGATSAYFDGFDIQTDIEHDSDANNWMDFSFNTDNIGQAGTGIKWNELVFGQLDASEGTDKTCLFDVYNVTDATTDAADLIDSPTDLSTFIPDSKIIYILPRFNNSTGQDSPKLTLLEVTYFEPPTIENTSTITGQTFAPPVWATIVNIGQSVTVILDTLIGQLPVAPQPSKVDDTVTVDAFYVDWGDGTNSGWVESNTIEHVYSSDFGSPFTMLTRCRDSEGIVSEDVSCNVAIVDVAPVCIARVSPIAGDVSVTVITADLTESYDPNENDAIISYDYDWGDGNTDLINVNSSLTHIYTTAGNFKSRYRVTDGNANDSEWIEVYVVITDTLTPTDVDLYALLGKSRHQDLKFSNVAQMVSEGKLNAEWMEYEDLDDKERILSFELYLPELLGQQERDNWIGYFENRTILRIKWQALDWADNPDVRYFTGKIASLPFDQNTGKQSEKINVVMIREA